MLPLRPSLRLRPRAGITCHQRWQRSRSLLAATRGRRPAAGWRSCRRLPDLT